MFHFDSQNCHRSLTAAINRGSQDPHFKNLRENPCVGVHIGELLLCFMLSACLLWDLIRNVRYHGENVGQSVVGVGVTLTSSCLRTKQCKLMVFLTNGALLGYLLCVMGLNPLTELFSKCFS